jgi:histidine triad (HIT) family protein
MKNENCVFCKIVNKEIPAEVVYEDANLLAFLSINPFAPGHTLVIPKDHYHYIWDIPEAESAELFKIVRKIAIAQKKAFNSEVIHGKIEGKEVPHAHFWVYPDPETPGDKKNFKTNAEKIKIILGIS